MKKTLLCFILLMFAGTRYLAAQNYNITNSTVSTCTGNFFDSGGNSGGYGNSQNLVMTFCASTSGECLRVNFSSFDIESGFDFLTVYNGATTGAPVIGVYTGTTIPASFTSTTGCLTFEFTSDIIFTGPGWEASITCVPCPGSACPSCNGGAPPANDACAAAQNLGALPMPVACPNGAGAWANFNTTNICATAENPYSSLTGCQPSGNMASPAADVWYRFTITAPTLNIQIAGMQSPNIGLYAGNNCNNLVGRGCAVGGGGTLNTSFGGLAPGSYYLQVSGGNPNDQCAFTLSLQNNYDCAGCVIQSNFTAVPPPVNGTYQAGQSVTFCYTITDYNQTSVNWLHGVVPTFSSGWDMSTLTTVPANECTGSGTWAWYNTNVTSTATGDVTGPGFYYETAAGSSSGFMDGNPGNNFGDNNSGNSCDWTFCWTISTLPPASCIPNAPLNISVNSLGDGESGSWTSLACVGDPTADFFATLSCCVPPLVAVTDPLCFGQNTGAATGTGQGTAPWDYIWKNGSGATIQTANGVNGSNSISNLAPGNYSLTCIDNTGCSSVASFTITAPAQIVLNTVPVDADCNGATDGSATVNPVGGTTPYQYLWSSGGTSATETGLGVGTYTVTVTDDNGCTASTTATISEPPPMVINVVATDAACGANNGTLTINAAGGSAPLTYSIDNGTTFQAGNVFNNLSAGNYDVVVEDASGCQGITTGQVNNSLSPVIDNTVVTDVLCNGAADGSIVVNVSGGTGAITYSNNNGSSFQPGNTFNNLASGSYDIVAEDANGCQVTVNVVVNEPPVITISLAGTDPICEQDNGTVTVTAGGGTGTLQYSIDGGAFQPSNVFTNLSAANHSVTVIDDNGCTAADAIMLNTMPPLAVNGVSASASCGNATGTITANANGGTVNYQFSIDGGPLQASGSFSNLAPGSYDISVTDANGCTAVTTVVVTDQPGPVITSAAVTDVNCFAGSDGSITVNVNGGTPALSYSIDNGPFQPGATFNGLPAGNYQVLVSDLNGCTAITNAVVAEPVVIDGPWAEQPATCGNTNGSITVNGSGGTGVLNYSLDGGAFQSSNVFGSLAAGNYNITIEDENGCTLDIAVTVTDIPGPDITSIVPALTSCNGGNDGSLTVTTNLGTAPLQFSINNGVTSQASGIFTGLTAGTYTILVTDANGCTTSSSEDVTEPPLITSGTVTTGSTCGFSNGNVDITASNGTGNLEFSLDGGPFQSSGTYNNLPSGNYNYTVQDANGCTVTGTFNISDAPGPVISASSTTDALCNGSADGTATVTANGGTAPLQYSIQGGSLQATGNFTLLVAGSYTVLVTDANGCTVEEVVDVLEPPVVTLAIAVAGTTCSLSNGSLTATANGGTGAFTYSLDGGAYQPSDVFSNLAAGNYTVTVQDANGCTTSENAVIVDAPPPVITDAPVTDASCMGASDGTITINANGGTGVLEYSIDNGTTYEPGNTFTNLPAGTYDIVVTDANGCTVTVQVIISQPTPLMAGTLPVAATCSEANGNVTINASGGTAPYQYSVNSGTPQASNYFDNLAAGNYDVTITDVNGCELQVLFFIPNLPGPAITSTAATDVLCNGGNDGTATITISGGTAPIDYSLNGGPAQANGSFINLAEGNYTIIVTDANGCTESTQVVIGTPTPVSATAVTTTSACGNSNGDITVNASGGTDPYQFAINGGANQASPTFSNLAAGNYDITVTDNNGCTILLQEIITDLPAPSITSVNLTDVTCNGGADGAFTINTNGGATPLTFSIDNGTTNQASSTFSGLLAGTYDIVVTDANGCTVTTQSIISEPAILAGASSTTQASCGNSDGTLTVVANGGVAAYQYSIDGGTNNQASGLFSSLAAGTYDITITDANGCTAIVNVSISNTAAPAILSVNATDLTCFNADDGTININANGGTAPLSFSIDNGVTIQASNQFSALPDGSYSIIVEDALGCQATSNITISAPDQLIAPVVIVNTTCSNANGTITINASGGSANYTYSINGGTTSQPTGIFGNIPAGNYSVLVTDANGCTVSSNQVVTDAPGPSVTNVNTTDISCNGGNNGSITINATGGTGATEYSIDNGTTFTPGNTFSALLPGNYNILITDINGCTDASTVTLTEPDAISFNTSATPASCGNSDGTLTINASGGAGNFTYSIDNGTTYQASPDFNGIAAGSYQVVVQDANGCTIDGTGTVNNAAAPVITATSFTDIDCNGADNGTITVTANGGTGALQYSVDNGVTFQAGNTFSNLSPGNYDIIVEDINGCQAADAITITEPAQLGATFIIGNTTCGTNNGNLDITASGGTGTIVYSIDNGSTFQASATFANITAGNYQVVLEDDNGCQETYPVTLSDAPGPDIQTVSGTDITCNGAADGSFTITATGGTGILEYSNDNGVTFQLSTDFNALSPGTYDIVVRDENGCTTTSAATISEPDVITFSTTDTPASCGNSDGSLTILASGGTGNYSYSIDNGATVQGSNVFTGLPSGNYSVVIEDANGCTTDGVTAVSNAAAPAITATAYTDITCNGADDGTITVTANGGTGVLQYSNNNGTSFQPGNTFTNLSAGSYDIIVEDVNGCEATASITIAEPMVISAAMVTVNTTCSGSNGSIDVTGSGGTGTLTYSSDSGLTFQASPIFSGLSAGNYNILLEDDNGCQSLFPVLITDAPGPVVQAVTAANLSCFGTDDGEINVTVTGGTTPLQYSIDNGVTTQSSGIYTLLAPGNYSVLVTDANGCTIIAPATITEPDEITASFGSTNASCGNADGTISITAAGGTGAYQYSIDNGTSFQASATFTFLNAGNYQVIIRDANGCTATIATSVNNAAAPSIQSTDVTMISCNGMNDGIIDISASGGTGALAYSINNGSTSQATGIFPGLSPGIYNIIVTDINGCFASGQVILTDPLQLTATTVTATATCSNNNGTITVNAQGGTGNLVYSNDGGTQFQASNIFNNLSQAVYVVVVQDDNGCTYTLNANVANAPGPVLSLVIPTDITCNGFDDGSITVLANGGTAPLQYSIDNGTTSVPGFVFGSLAPGNYDILVTDANGCTLTSTATLTEPVAITSSAQTSDANCGNSDGSITITANGGSGNYTYSLNGINFQASNNFGSLPAGTYTVVVRDGSDCTAAAPVTVNNASAPNILNAPAVNVSCFGQDDGTISIQVAGGATPYSYSIDGGFTWQLTGNYINLGPGIYDITVTDANGCEALSQATISEPAEIVLSASATTATCGNNDGSVTVSVNGGGAGYTFSLNGGSSQPTGSFNNLAAGNYDIIVMNAAGCSESIVASVNNTNAPVISAISNTDVSCFGASDGSIQVTANGGTGALQYSIDNGATFQPTASYNNLPGGMYNIVVEDGNGCLASSAITVDEPLQLTLNTLATAATCGNANGELETLISGGTNPVQYSIDNGVTFQAAGTFGTLSAGAYVITAEDANGCSATSPQAVTNIPGPTINSLPVINSSCFGSDDASVEIHLSGGTGPFLYSLDGGATTQPSNYFDALTPGAYTIIVTDANGCEHDSIFAITEPVALTIAYTLSNATCSGSNASITLTGSGGTGAFTYSINGGLSFQPSSIFNSLLSGAYEVLVKDNNGCIAEDSVQISDAPAPAIQSVQLTDATCNGADNGELLITTSGGTLPLQYSIDNGGTFQAAAQFGNLTPGVYTLVVTDANGCSTFGSGTIYEPAALLTSASTSAALCNGSGDGSATVTVLGGVQPYSYSWSSGATLEEATSLAAGTYTVTVTDDNGCTATSSVAVTEPTPVNVTESLQDISCNGLTDGSVTITLAGGTAPYGMTWSDPLITGLGNGGLGAGSYSVTVTDANGCSVNQSYTITEPAMMTISSSATAVTCYGLSNGAASVITGGGTAPYTYIWSNNNVTAMAGSLPAGTYTVTVTDDHGCTITATETILAPDELIAVSSSTPVSCNGVADGSASVTVSGGTVPYSYSWSSGSATVTAAGLDGGTFTVTVTDANNCVTNATATIIEPQPIGLNVTGAATICIGQQAILSATATGGNGGYIFNWSNGTVGDTQSVAPGTTTSYSVSVTDSLGCTAQPQSLTIIVNPALSLALIPADTLCEGESSLLVATANGGDGGPYTYTWSGLTSTGSSVTVTPAATTTYMVTVTDGCGTPAANQSVIITVNPLPVISFTPQPAEGCAPLSVSFENNTVTSSGAFYQWYFGDNFSSNDFEPVHLYTEPGNYTVTLKAISAEGCINELVVQDAVKVYPVPTAAIIAYPHVVSILHPEIEFLDAGTGATNWSWDFGDNSIFGIIQNPRHVYEATGMYNIILYVTNDYGCADTAYTSIMVEGASTVYIPNAFSPNGDGVNDVFKIEGIGLMQSEMMIFNRWGNQVYKSGEQQKGWDGTDIYTGEKCQVDVYLYVIKLKNFKGEPEEKTGRVTLVR